jgi:hypothetical protein
MYYRLDRGEEMRRPEVILHNSISPDGCISDFTVNIDLHHGIVGNYGAEIYIAGSSTAKTGTLREFFQLSPLS